MNTPEKLVEEHWKYIRDTLKAHGVHDLAVVEHHYKTAFIHGYKHGAEDSSGNK